MFPSRPSLEPGTNIAVLIRHLGFWSLNGGRVVYELPRSDHEFGYAYGTLTSHAEAGEEIHPIARLLQARFRRDSADAMTRAINS